MRFVCLWSPRWEIGGAPLAELATTLLDHAPRVAVEARGMIWADARGLPALRLAGTLPGCLGGKRGEVRAGVADVPIAAEAAARSGETPVTLVESGRERAFLTPLSLDLLRPDPHLSPLLAGVGIRTCGHLAALSREAVEVRFGAAGSALWRLTRADDPRLLFGPIPRERPHASIDFVDYAVRDAARLVFSTNALLGSVCQTLRARDERARRMTLSLALSGGGMLRRELRVSRPTADRAAWLARVRDDLERLVLPDTVTGLGLTVEDEEPTSASQGDLFDRGFATVGAVEEAVVRLMDSLGPVFVHPETDAHPLAEQRTSWQPEEPAAVADGGSRPADSLTTACLSLQLLPEPRSIAVRTRPRRDHLLPLRYQDRGSWHALAEAAGPDRVSGGHDDAPYAREYFRCVSEDGRLVWLFHDALEDAWYLHGWWE